MQHNYREGWQRQVGTSPRKPSYRRSAEDEYYESGDWLAER